MPRPTDSPTSPRGRKAVLALVAILTVALASAIGGWSTYPEIAGWYAGLAKPSFNPPNWIFGPVWTVLYASMAYAFWRVLARSPNEPGRATAIGAFLVQIVLNAAWSIAFFGNHSPAAGLIVIALLWIAICVTIRAFARLDRFAAWLLAPYLAWVTFAALLNFAIWRLNG